MKDWTLHIWGLIEVGERLMVKELTTLKSKNKIISFVNKKVHWRSEAMSLYGCSYVTSHSVWCSCNITRHVASESFYSTLCQKIIPLK